MCPNHLNHHQTTMKCSSNLTCRLPTENEPTTTNQQLPTTNVSTHFTLLNTFIQLLNYLTAINVSVTNHFFPIYNQLSQNPKRKCVMSFLSPNQATQITTILKMCHLNRMRVDAVRVKLRRSDQKICLCLSWCLTTTN